MTPRYRLDGPPEAPVLVLPSSLGTTTGLWEANVEHWSVTFRLVRYDLHGRDSVEDLGRDLVGLLDELAIGRASVCGLSLGGAAAMWAAANAPDRIDRLVLACTSARFGEPRFWRERATLVRTQGLGPIADGIVARWFTPGERAEVVAGFRRMLVETPREAYAACCDALARWDFRGRLSELRASTLVIAGAEDPATPPDHAELIAAGIPDASLAVIPGASHLANVGQPEEFSRLVASHLAAVEVA
jgi:3-oxoadipate enol-lactonase